VSGEQERLEEDDEADDAHDKKAPRRSPAWRGSRGKK